MRIVVAPDSFKGTLSAREAAEAIKSGIERALPLAEVLLRPMADGGDGTSDVLSWGLSARVVEVPSLDPLGRAIVGQLLLIDDTTTVVELSSASGLLRLAHTERTADNAIRASRFGTGLLLQRALDLPNAITIVVTLGGSATTDGGFGLLGALGASFQSSSGAGLDPRDASNLARVHRVELSEAARRLRAHRLIVAVDVANPLIGPCGAARTFGGQKGLSGAAAARRDEELERWANLLTTTSGVSSDVAAMAGVGAAGGAALPLLVLGNATLISGAEYVAQRIGLADDIAKAEWVITGEGCTDAQSAGGKVPGYVTRLAAGCGVRCSVLSGSIGEGYEQLIHLGASEVTAASPHGVVADVTPEQATEWLEKAAFHLALRH